MNQKAAAITPGQNRRGRRYRQHEADEQYHAEMREFIVRKTREGLSVEDISGILSVPPKIVRTYLDRSITRVNELRKAGVNPREAYRRPRNPEDGPPIPHRVTRGPGSGPHVRKSSKAAPLVPTKAVNRLYKQAWELRKRMLPFDEIGRLLGVSEQMARDAVKRRYAELDAMELENADQAREIMIAQIDSMIQALMTAATGKTMLGQKVKVDHYAIDRMIKLLDSKAKLLGLNAAAKIDIRVQLKKWAEAQEYDYDEVEQVAAEVIAARSER